MMCASSDCRILVVDRSLYVQRIIAAMLDKIGNQSVITASDSSAALALIVSAKFDLIITSWHMTPLNGSPFVHAIRADADHEAVPILIITNGSAMDDILAGLDTGVNDYIIEPFTSDALKKKIDNILMDNQYVMT